MTNKDARESRDDLPHTAGRSDQSASPVRGQSCGRCRGYKAPVKQAIRKFASLCWPRFLRQGKVKPSAVPVNAMLKALALLTVDQSQDSAHDAGLWEWLYPLQRAGDENRLPCSEARGPLDAIGAHTLSRW